MSNAKSEEQINDIIEKLTLEEKNGMIHGAGLFRTEGVKRLDIPSVKMSDGSMGVRAEFADAEWVNVGLTGDYVTYFPCNSAIASTWSRELAAKFGKMLGEESRGRGKDMILAPSINIKRTPLCGRNYEYMSEDPRLIEELVVPMVQGIQENDVAACVKHFAANSQETERLWINTLVDEQTLQEIYYPGFKAAVQKGGCYALMGAYNLLNGEHCCTSKYLLNKVLRSQWGYDGVVISDWGGVHDTIQASEAGIDIEMDVKNNFSEYKMADVLLKKVKNKEVKESLIDQKVCNILRMMFRLRMVGKEKSERKSGSYNTRQHQEAALGIARESLILLKNQDEVLPLKEKKIKRIALIGQNAAVTHANGGGSSEIKALYEITPLMGIKKMLGGNVEVNYAPGYVIPKKINNSEINWQADSTMHREAETGNNELHKDNQNVTLQKQYLTEAVELAKNSDAVIYVGGLNHDYDTEGMDRADMKLPYAQDYLIETLLQVNPDTVLVLYGGSPVEMPWLKKAKALLWSYYAGMEGGTALAETLFGKNNPCGKLAETFIREQKQCPALSIGTFGKRDQVEYKEGVMVGYRYYDTYDTKVNFCFGYGLSFTSFKYGNLKAEEKKTKEKRCITLSFDLKNTGNLAGKETAQIYVAPVSQEGNLCEKRRPAHELKNFIKVSLKPQEQQRITLNLTELDFSSYNVKQQAFSLVKGVYEIQVAASSREILLRQEISLD